MKFLTNKYILYFLILIPLVSFFNLDELTLLIKNNTAQAICFAILGLGINYSIGHAGVLNLGGGGFMAVGAYVCSILVATIYPFQFNYFIAYIFAIIFGGAFGFLLSTLSLRLKGDYLAIITLAFAEIIQDILKNLEVITKGTKGINPLPDLQFLGFSFSAKSWSYYYLLILIFIIANFAMNKLSKSRLGLRILATKDDEIAASSLGLNPIRYRTIALIISGALCALSGAIYVTSLGTSGEPGNYDFSVSVLALCIVIMSGVGNSSKILISSIAIIIFTNILLPGLSTVLISLGLTSTDSLILNSNNWKYFIFGLILILTMRMRTYVKN